MSIVTERVYRVTSWDAEHQAVVERVFTEYDMDNFKDTLRAIHHAPTDEMDVLSLIKHRYYGAPYYEFNEQRYTYRQADDTDGADTTHGDNDTVQLSNDALYAIG